MVYCSGFTLGVFDIGGAGLCIQNISYYILAIDVLTYDNLLCQKDVPRKEETCYTHNEATIVSPWCVHSPTDLELSTQNVDGKDICISIYLYLSIYLFIYLNGIPPHKHCNSDGSSGARSARFQAAMAMMESYADRSDRCGTAVTISWSLFDHQVRVSISKNA